MSKQLVPIDFEYRGTSEKILDLICCSFSVDGTLFEYWLRDETNFKECKRHLLHLREEGAIFVCWNGIAEGQAFISLGIDPIRCKWMDLQAEYKMLTNHNHIWMYGRHLLDGKKVVTKAPSYGEDKTVSNARPKHNLAAGCYKLLDVFIDTDHKDEMRKICIHGTPEELESNRLDIQRYCSSDIKYLLEMWGVIRKYYLEYFRRKQDDSGKAIQVTWEDILWRGETMARTAMMTAVGYPVDEKKMRTFADNVKGLLKELCEDINDQFPDRPLFSWNNREQRYSRNTKVMKEIIAESEYADKWTKTAPSARFPEGSYSLSIDVFERLLSFRHSFPEGNPLAQYMRYLKTQRSLNGFIPKGDNAKNRETIFDSLGTDKRVRAYLNPYGSQSARYQPKATAFIPLKSAWVRSLISAPRSRAIAGIDFKSEEFLLGGLVSGDTNMLEAYKSGDVYLYFAKLSGAVPWDGTKEQYKEQRNLFKSTTLGISYLMGPEALGRKLSGDTGVNYSTGDASDLISKFGKAYPQYTKWQDDIYYFYERKKCIKLPCGWIMFGDNPNQRSVKNMPIQGIGSSILRKAIALAQDAGLKVIFGLHDALYIEYDSFDFKQIDILRECMREAFGFYFEGDMKKQAMELIGFDTDTWSLDYEDGYGETPDGYPFKQQTIYVDERARDEYEKFKKYMEA